MSVKLTENQIALLKSAALRKDRCFVLPPNLKGGAAQKVAAKLIAEKEDALRQTTPPQAW
jgi:hypothetical protein